MDFGFWNSDFGIEKNKKKQQRRTANHATRQTFVLQFLTTIIVTLIERDSIAIWFAFRLKFPCGR